MEAFFVDGMGYVGNICLAICALPQAYKCWKEKSAYGLSWGWVILCVLGEYFGLSYLLLLMTSESSSETNLLPMVLNYGTNCIAMAIILYYKAFGKKLPPKLG
jgi:uncharacterized protein with PQ loop repeat